MPETKPAPKVEPTKPAPKVEPVKSPETKPATKVEPAKVPETKPATKVEPTKVQEAKPAKKIEPPTPSSGVSTAAKVVTAAAAGAAGGSFLKNMIATSEGNIAYPYKDSKGLWTIGIGHLIQPGGGKTLPEKYAEWSKNGKVGAKGNNTKPAMTPEEVNKLFEEDLNTHMKIAEKFPNFDKFNESGQAALIDLAFNIPETTDRRKWPSFLAALDKMDVKEAVKHLLSNGKGGPSQYSKDVGSRATRTANLLLNGVDKNSATPIPEKGTTNTGTGTKLNDASTENKDLKQTASPTPVVINNNGTTLVNPNQGKQQLSKPVNTNSPYLNAQAAHG